MEVIIMGRHKKEKWVYIDMPCIKKNYYEISTWGRIRNKKGNFLKYYKDKDGYMKCTLFTESNKRKHFFVHRLLAIHFIPNPENKPEVNHLYPEDKTKLYVEYLEWATGKENKEHSKKTHRQEILSCSAHGMATLSNEQVHEICKLIVEGYKNSEICDKFGVTDKKERYRFKGVIKHIRSGNTWKPISSLYGLSKT